MMEFRKVLLEIMRDQKQQHIYYLQYLGGAELLAADIYRWMLPMGW